MSSYGNVKNGNIKNGNVKRRKKRRRTGFHFVLGLIAVAVIILAFLIIKRVVSIGVNQTYVKDWSQLLAQVSSPSSSQATINGATVDVTGTNYPIITIAQKDPNVENILLLGIDGEGAKAGNRSDSMIVVSLNSKTKTVKLTSFMRDIRSYFKDKNTYDKLNAAYDYGGPGQTVNIINNDFNLDIQKYVVVDFSGFRKIVDAIGGVQITVTKRESTQITGLKTKGAGTYLLNGKQALAYARIRKIDNDYYRTKRQQNVLMAIYNKLKSSSLTEKISVANTFIDYVKTNLSTAEILSLVNEYASSISSVDKYTVPQSDMWYDKYYGATDYVVIKDWDKQNSLLNNYIYSYGSESSSGSTTSSVS